MNSAASYVFQKTPPGSMGAANSEDVEGVNHPIMQEETESLQQRFESLFEQMSLFFDQHPVWSKEVIAAKKLFFEATGKIKETDDDFTNRMNAFLWWFLFDWQASSIDRSPIEYYYEKLNLEQSGQERRLIEQQRHHVHSLFCFVREKQGRLVVKDILTNRKYVLWGNLPLLHHLKQSVFETRLFCDHDRYVIANYLIHHPASVRSAIFKRVGQIRKQKRSIKPFLLQLHAYHTKWRRYRNINIKSIYYFDKSLPEAK